MFTHQANVENIRPRAVFTSDPRLCVGRLGIRVYVDVIPLFMVLLLIFGATKRTVSQLFHIHSWSAKPSTRNAHR